ncbi:hypothetical protein ACFWAR_25330 [Streptomyces sp. NPDC059917]|uniref:hypothetical protein n=1 Tax=Streptomyces sp. NPDC059917 TaxID=3347002 RepID=UPI00365E4CB9
MREPPVCRTCLHTILEFSLTTPLGGRMTAAKKRCIGTLTVIAAVLTLAACDPAASTGTLNSGTPSSSVTAGASGGPTATSSPSVSPTPSSSPTPTPSATPSVVPSSAPPTAKAPAPAPPAPTRTRTQAPAPDPEPTRATTDCYPRSNAGNCYKAGQICRKADVGSDGRDAAGRAIYCRHDSSVGQRWGY